MLHQVYKVTERLKRHNSLGEGISEREREMAVGGGHVKGNLNSNRGIPFRLMLLLAFGAAILGVMLIHKIRERRIFTLLLKEKDHDLLSLQLLLQKERETAKEAKEKFEEMRTKIYSLRTHKMELDSRIMEMQSTISSLKDEQRTMESELEEKQNEIKALREKEAASDKEHSQVIAMTEMLKLKEAEIQDLKQHLENPVKVWSVSTDDPSKQPMRNFTVGEIKDRDDSNTKESEKKENGENNVNATEEFADQNQSTAQSEGESSFGSLNRSERGTTQDGDLQQQQQQNYSKESSAEGMEAEKSIDGDTDSKANNGFARYGRLGNLHASQESEGQEAEGGMKLEVPETAGNGLDSGMRRKHGYAKKMKGKRARLMGKLKGLRQNKNTENNGASTMTISEVRPEKELYNGTRFGDENGKVETVENSEKSEDLLRKTGNQDAMEVRGEASEMLISAKERTERDGTTAKDNDEATSEGASFQKSQNVEDDENQKNKMGNVESKQDMEMEQANNLGDGDMKMKQANVLEDGGTVKVNDEATLEGTNMLQFQNVEDDKNQENKVVNAEKMQEMEMKQANVLEDSSTAKNNETTLEGANMQESQNVEDDEQHQNKMVNTEREQDAAMKQGNAIEDGGREDVNNKATLEGANLQKSENQKDEMGHAETYQEVEIKQGKVLEDGGMENSNPFSEEPLTNKSDHGMDPNREVKQSDVQEDPGSQVTTSEKISRAKDAEQAKDAGEDEKKEGSETDKAKYDTQEKEGSEAAEVHELGLNQTQHETFNKLRSKREGDNKESKGENEEKNKEEKEEPEF